MSAIEVWDDDEGTPAGAATTLLWRRYPSVDFPAAISIPELVERHAERLRRRYLAWVMAVGEARVGAATVIDHFRVRDGVSFWWSSLITEKCNSEKSPDIEDAIRLMAFDDWAAGRAITRVRLRTANAALASCLRAWCARHQAEFVWSVAVPRRGPGNWRRRLVGAMPAPAQALTWLLVYLARRWPLRGVGVAQWSASRADVTFVSFLSHSTVYEQGIARFSSYFWGPLPAVLEQEGVDVNWLHVYVPDPLVPRADGAGRAIRDFNQAAGGRQNHVVLDSFLSIGLVARTIREWVRLCGLARRCEREFVAPDSEGLEVWPELLHDFRHSFAGIAGISGVLYLNLLEVAIGALTRQRLGAYLHENQGWELSLLQLWRAAGHGPVVGHSHSTVRFWDLRYFWDRGSIERRGPLDAPLPDTLAVNGPVAENELRLGGYPPAMLTEVEALRYLPLHDVPGGDRKPAKAGPVLRLLVLGDFSQTQSQFLMELLEQAVRLVDAALEITLKPHTACPIAPELYPGVSFTLTKRPVAALLFECDVALTGATTSAAVDAYCLGVPVISVLNPSTLNLSPLRGREGVSFVSNAQELASALSRRLAAPAAPPAGAFFCTDPSLRRWRQLVKAGTAEPQPVAAN